MKKYLIHVGPGIGDMMQFLSMARDIKTQEPDSRVDFFMRGTPTFFKIDSNILECQNYVDHLYWYSLDSFFHNIKLIFQLLFAGRYDYGLLRPKLPTFGSLWPYRIFCIIRCGKIIGAGYSLYRGVDVKISHDNLHYLEWQAEYLKAIGIKPVISTISLSPTVVKQYLPETFKVTFPTKIVGLSVGTNKYFYKVGRNKSFYDVKSWPYSNWLILAQHLSEKGFVVVLIGGVKERKEIIESGLTFPQHKNILDFIGKTNIKESLAIVSCCQLMVGAEGGMMHSAAAFGVKTLTLFGGSDYVKWNPGGPNGEILSMNYDCSPCFMTQRAIECRNHKCINDLTIDTVKNRIILLLKNLSKN